MNPFPIDLLLLSIATPLAAALIIAFGPSRKIAMFLAYIGFSVPALVAIYLVGKFAGMPLHHGYAYFTSYDLGLAAWGIKLTLGLNGISLGLFALAGIVGFAAGFYAIQSGAERLRQYLLLLLVMQGGLMGVFASVDIFFFYFFHEFALIATFIMVGVWGGRDRNYAAMMMTIYLTLGAMLSLAGLIAIYWTSGAANFDLIALREAIAAQPLSEVVQKNIFGILMFGFGILVSLFPLHSWAPLGYGAAPSSAAMLHAGVLKKFGLYGLVQIALPLIPSGAAHWSHILAILALCNVVIIGFVTIAQTDLKQMIGYSSVMHMGYAFLGVAAMSTLGAGGVVLMMIAHGLSVALLFLLSTSIHHRTQTFDMTAMGGLAKQAPLLSALFVAAIFASIGLPGFANFWGELTIFVALWGFSKWMTIAAVAGIIISAIYGLRAAARIFFGPPTETFAKVAAENPVTDLRWSERVPAFVLLAALVLVGVWPKIVTTPLNAQLTSATISQSATPNQGVASNAPTTATAPAK
ncbi:NADH-quinone oxidoreductase subunit M [Ereboglobus sp. PH5-5]|uniref:complex I subunit 4 family protein n=1 Tax=Ereboglobus sp. PH5-5 TaxID=2940529 RepID=UPI002406A7C5|nr:NADH-quinone oxidoreductase subunit M [Ereboglobus sp. PH5-5]MDF9833297.1 NADH-quinone oxidoreductase subunit M [Ereboglobus sp. PH5-5]